MDQRYIADALAVLGALARQIELWQREPATTADELMARHERVKAFMRQVQLEADALR